MREPFAGLVHFFIFWGFVFFLIAVVEAIIQGFYSPFQLSFLRPVYSVITLVHELIGILVIAAVILALFRRYIIKVPRLQVDKSASIDATFILSLILVVVLSMFFQNMSSYAANGYTEHAYELRPISSSLTSIFFSNPSAGAATAYEVFWWVHIVTIFGFMNFLPYSKHLHVLTSIPNTFFVNLDPIRNTLKPLDLED